MSRVSFITVSLAAVVATSGWVHAYRTQAAVQSFVQSIDRTSSGVLQFSGNTLLADFRISHGAPVWKESYDPKGIKQSKIPDGTRFRFGNNFWSTIETNVDLTIGGAEVPVGYYYLAFEKQTDAVNIVAFPADDLRKQRVGSWQPPQTGGIVIPMSLDESGSTADELTCDFVVDNRSGASSLEVEWGPYALTAPVEIGAADQG